LLRAKIEVPPVICLKEENNFPNTFTHLEKKNQNYAAYPKGNVTRSTRERERTDLSTQ
jgi:hypothetical protein